VIYLAILAVLGIVWWLVPGSGIFVFAGLVAAAVLLELVIAIWGVRGVRRPLVPWLALGLGTFALALLVWRLSWTGAPLCDPSSLLQGHALWHILAEAVAPLMFFAHFRRENRSELPVRSAAPA
jgi:dihydroceramidase